MTNKNKNEQSKEGGGQWRNKVEYDKSHLVKTRVKMTILGNFGKTEQNTVNLCKLDAPKLNISQVR